MRRMLAAAGLAALMASPAVASEAPVSASLPPALQALEAKMAQLQVNSERYLTLTRGSVVTSITLHVSRGKGHSHIHRTRVGTQQLGEVSLAPAEGELYGGAHLTEPQVIATGSTLYVRGPKLASRDCGRPWTRSPSGVESTGLFPYHGSASEVSLGGSGSYAGLINLLATATGSVSSDGPVTVEGQPTTEFTAQVEPLLLIGGLTPKEKAAVHKHRLPVTLSVFIAESGLPLRVVSQFGVGASQLTETTEIVAVNVPVSVKAPPAEKTISEKQLGEVILGGHLRCRRKPTKRKP
jgi:hypothetical protein